MFKRLLFSFLFAVSAFAAPVEPLPTPAPLTITGDPYKLALQRTETSLSTITQDLQDSISSNASTIAKLADVQAQLKASQTANAAALAASQANQKLAADAQIQIKAQDAQIESLRWERWKYAIYGTLLGIVLGIAAYFAVKFGLFSATAAAKLGITLAK